MPQVRARFRVADEYYPQCAVWIGESVVRAATAWFMSKFRLQIQSCMGDIGINNLAEFIEALPPATEPNPFPAP